MPNQDSPSNYENSASNYDNSHGSKRRIYLEEEGPANRLGYYVISDNGVINFYSDNAERVFYIPAESSAVFHGEEGFFCGVLLREKGQLKLGLTRKGLRMLFIAQ